MISVPDLPPEPVPLPAKAITAAIKKKPARKEQLQQFPTGMQPDWFWYGVGPGMQTQVTNRPPQPTPVSFQPTHANNYEFHWDPQGRLTSGRGPWAQASPTYAPPPRQRRRLKVRR